MKALPHRLRDGRCRDCGHHDAYSAPDTCSRCAVQRMAERGYRVEPDPVRRFDHYGHELWRAVAHGIRSGAVKSGRFYVYVGHNDGGALELPLGDLAPGGWELPAARVAHTLAQAMTQRYPQAWVVTTVGCWEAAAPDTEGATS